MKDGAKGWDGSRVNIKVANRKGVSRPASENNCTMSHAGNDETAANKILLFFFYKTKPKQKTILLCFTLSNPDKP